MKTDHLLLGHQLDIYGQNFTMERLIFHLRLKIFTFNKKMEEMESAEGAE